MLQIQTVDKNKNLSFTDIGICGKKISHKPFSIAFVLRLKKIEISKCLAAMTAKNFIVSTPAAHKLAAVSKRTT